MFDMCLICSLCHDLMLYAVSLTDPFSLPSGGDRVVLGNFVEVCSVMRVCMDSRYFHHLILGVSIQEFSMHCLSTASSCSKYFGIHFQWFLQVTNVTVIKIYVETKKFQVVQHQSNNLRVKSRK